MENSKVIDRLFSLCQLDIDAVSAYDEAIQKIDIESLAEQLRQFRDDHERHISDLSSVIMQLGGQAPQRKPDMKGYLIEGFTSMRSITGTPGALKAMRGNEMLTNARYKAAQEMDLPFNVKTIIDHNYADEQRHLAYITQCIDDRVWEKYGQNVPPASNVDVSTGLAQGDVTNDNLG